MNHGRPSPIPARALSVGAFAVCLAALLAFAPGGAARADDGVEPRSYSRYWLEQMRRRPPPGRRVQSYDPSPRSSEREPRYPNGVTRRWVPGHMVGGYLDGGVWVPEYWAPGRMVEVLEID